MYPPALVAVMPFKSGRPASDFEGEVAASEVFSHSGLNFTGARWGEAFRVGRMAIDGDPYEWGLSVLEWNPEACQLVVLDGQHRVMSLLAIQRTITNSWDQSSGSEFAPFYEDKVRTLLEAADLSTDALAGLEMPIMVTWFPGGASSVADPEENVLRAARRLFVAVNQEAKPPSSSRLILLSETELDRIFVRDVLERLRVSDNEDGLPLIAIEYDNPDVEKARPDRWTAITNLQILSNCVRRTVFGPKDLLRDVEREIPGGPLGNESDLFMRKQLRVEELYQDDPPADMGWSSIGNMRFPEDQGPLLDEFWAGWGGAIATVLGGLSPYQEHCKVLSSLQKDWMGHEATLWYQALFEGTGLYWSLKRTHEASDVEGPVEASWAQVDGPRREALEQGRAEMAPEPPDGLDYSRDVMRDTYCTHACQLGLLLTLGGIAVERDLHGVEIGTLATEVVDALNAGLAGESSDGESRRYFVCKKAPKSLNRIRSLNTGDAVRFRYFWLELLSTEEAQAALGEENASIVKAAASKARWAYHEYLKKEVRRDMESVYGRDGVASRLAELLSVALAQQSEGLAHWLGMPEDDFTDWFEREEDERAED